MGLVSSAWLSRGGFDRRREQFRSGRLSPVWAVPVEARLGPDLHQDRPPGELDHVDAGVEGAEPNLRASRGGDLLCADRALRSRRRGSSRSSANIPLPPRSSPDQGHPGFREGAFLQRVSEAAAEEQHRRLSPVRRSGRW